MGDDVYDLVEARRLIAEAIDHETPDREGRIGATTALFTALQKLNPGPGTGHPSFHPKPNLVFVEWAGASAHLKMSPSGEITVGTDKGPPKVIQGLAYDVVTKRWEGTAADKVDPSKKRSAAAVVVEAVLKVLLQSANDED